MVEIEDLKELKYGAATSYIFLDEGWNVYLRDAAWPCFRTFYVSSPI